LSLDKARRALTGEAPSRYRRGKSNRDVSLYGITATEDGATSGINDLQKYNEREIYGIVKVLRDEGVK
jgi:hypothetical protein